MSAPILARIGITQDEWAEFRKGCIDSKMRPSQLLAMLVRAHLDQVAMRREEDGRPA